MTDWRIKALVRGEILGDKSINLQYTDMGESYWHPSTVYYLTDGTRHVLVDTGYGDPDAVNEQQSLFTVRADRSLASLLAAEAVPVEEIDTLVMTHLHWDHAGNVDQFDHADVYIQREAARYAYAPLEIHEAAFRSPSGGFDPSWGETAFRFVDGDEQLYPGLRVIHTPGHTPGHASLLVEQGETTVGLAIDVFPLYANAEGLGGSRFHPPGCTDVHAWWASAQRVMRAADVVVPSHDPDGPADEWIDASHGVRSR
jgi:glyoxylase-like metal-dependent hydrolase (beta-lactamase superfamily II)